MESKQTEKGAAMETNEKEKIGENNAKKMELLNDIIKDTEDARKVTQELAKELTNEPKKDKSFFSMPSWKTPSSSRSSKKVYVYIPEPTKSTNSFYGHFSKLMKKENVQLELIHDVSSRTTDPFLVVCHVTSRLQPDIDNTLQGISRFLAFAVIVLHVGREGTEPKLLASTTLTEDDKYKNIELIDMAYDPDSTIYNCSMNAVAFDKIKTFVAQH